MTLHGFFWFRIDVTWFYMEFNTVFNGINMVWICEKTVTCLEVQVFPVHVELWKWPVVRSLYIRGYSDIWKKKHEILQKQCIPNNRGFPGHLQKHESRKRRTFEEIGRTLSCISMPTFVDMSGPTTTATTTPLGPGPLGLVGLFGPIPRCVLMLSPHAKYY